MAAAASGTLRRRYRYPITISKQFRFSLIDQRGLPREGTRNVAESAKDFAADSFPRRARRSPTLEETDRAKKINQSCAIAGPIRRIALRIATERIRERAAL